MKTEKSEERVRALIMAFEMKGAGTEWDEIVDTLKAKGLRDAKGNPFTNANLRAAYSKWKRGALTLPSQRDEDYAGKKRTASPSEHDARYERQQEAPSTSGHDEPDEHYEENPSLDERDEDSAQKGLRSQRDAGYEDNQVPGPKDTGPEEDVDVFTQRVRKIVAEYLQNKQNIHTVSPPNEVMPPETKIVPGGKGKKGRRENRKYDRVTLTIDKGLAERFIKEAKTRNLSAGKLMDVILWNRYGCPPLSYGEETN